MLPSLLQHRLAVAIIAFAVSATAGVFLFARPQYRPPGSSLEVLSIPSYVTPAARGWTWPHGLPGFRIGDDMRVGNIFGVGWATLSALRIAAPPSRVDPQSLRVLGAVRLRPDTRWNLLVAGRDVRGRTCIGVQPGPAAPRYFCPEQLAGHVAVVNVAAQAPYGGNWSIYVNGVVSAAVTRVDVSTAATTWIEMRKYGKRVVHPVGPEVTFRRGDRTWGTFESFRGQPVPWNARVDFYGAHGKLASLPLRFTKPGSYVYVR
jgi:hypothetical protein